MLKSDYYAVIFTSQRDDADHIEYEKMGERMAELAKNQQGYLGMDTTRGADGFGITVSYWASEKDILAWKKNSEHQIAQEFGKSKWYKHFTTRVCKVEREYSSK